MSLFISFKKNFDAFIFQIIVFSEMWLVFSSSLEMKIKYRKIVFATLIALKSKLFLLTFFLYSSFLWHSLNQLCSIQIFLDKMKTESEFIWSMTKNAVQRLYAFVCAEYFLTEQKHFWNQIREFFELNENQFFPYYE